jgi:hypothetical protein
MVVMVDEWGHTTRGAHHAQRATRSNRHVLVVVCGVR